MAAMFGQGFDSPRLHGLRKCVIHFLFFIPLLAMRINWIMIAVLLFSMKSEAQTCSNTLFQKSFQHLNSQGPVQIAVLPSHNMFVSGGTNSYGLVIAKLKENGDTISTKYISSSTGNAGINSQLVRDGDQKLLIVFTNRIYSLDTNSNVLSVQQLITSQSESGQDQIKKIQVLSDGDKIIAINVPSGCVIVRANENLTTVKWSKFFTVDKLSVEDFLLDDNKIVLVGPAIDPLSGTANSFLAQLNVENGSFLKYRVLKPSEAGNSYINQIFKTGNTYVASVFMNGASVSSGKYFIVRMDTSLNIISAKRLKPSIQSGVVDYSFFFSPNDDGSYYGAASATYTSLSAHLRFKINNDDIVSWTSTLPIFFTQVSDFAQNKDGLFEVGFGNYNNAVLNRSESYFSVTKTDFNGVGLTCYAQSASSLELTNYQFSESVSQNRPVLKDSVFSFVRDVVNYSYPATNISANCTVTNACSKITILGNTVVCGKQPQLYVGQRNSGCQIKVDWASLPKDAASIVSNNDSSIEVTFIKDGIYKIKGSLNSDCNFADSLIVRVNMSGVNLGNDTVLCNNNLVLHAGTGFKNYAWQDGSSDSVFTVTSLGIYYVTVVNYCDETMADTIHIDTGPNYQFVKKQPLLICKGDSVQITAPDGFSSYSWVPNYAINNNYLQNPNVSPETDTTYIVTVKDQKGCKAADTSRIVVQRLPVLQFPADTILCDKATFILRATQIEPAAKYLWQDLSVGDTLVVKQAGAYRVIVTINGCAASADSKISYVATPAVNLGKDTVKCIGDVVELNAAFPGAKYLWQDNSQQQMYTARTGGVYYCTVSNYCGSVSDTIVIKEQICECNPIIPNAFSPNGDGINDLFRPIVNCTPESYQMQIYDRDGQIIFETKRSDQYWDGTFNSKPAPIGVYYYFLRIKGSSEIVPKIRNGSITLIR